MKTPEIIFVGTITVDRVGLRDQIGGSAFYGAKAAQKLGAHVGIWTSAEKKIQEQKLFEGMDVVVSNSDFTTTFQHEYDSQTGHRTVRCTKQAEPLKSSTLPEEWKTARAVVFCPNANDVLPEHIQLFSSSHLMLLPQGWFRRFHTDGSVTFETLFYPNVKKSFDLIVASEEDLVGDSTAWDRFKKNAQVAVKTLGRKGHIVFSEGKEIFMEPPFVAKDIEPTGAGDVFATSLFLSMLSGTSPIDGAQIASVAASFAVEKPGIEGLPTQKDIQKRLKT